jgi:DNA-directed RNA polymerase specialized sigma24 family protein
MLLHQALMSAIGALPNKLAILMSLALVDGLSPNEISTVMSLSEKRVLELRADAIRRMSAALTIEQPTELLRTGT